MKREWVDGSRKTKDLATLDLLFGRVRRVDERFWDRRSPMTVGIGRQLLRGELETARQRLHTCARLEDGIGSAEMISSTPLSPATAVNDVDAFSSVSSGTSRDSVSYLADCQCALSGRGKMNECGCSVTLIL